MSLSSYIVTVHYLVQIATVKSTNCTQVEINQYSVTSIQIVGAQTFYFW